jgi:hypothetical protein
MKLTMLKSVCFFCHNWFWDLILVVIAKQFLPVLSPLMNLGIGYRRLRSYLNVLRPMRHGSHGMDLGHFGHWFFCDALQGGSSSSAFDLENVLELSIVPSVGFTTRKTPDTEKCGPTLTLQYAGISCRKPIVLRSKNEQTWMHLIFRSPIIAHNFEDPQLQFSPTIKQSVPWFWHILTYGNIF